MNNVEKIKLYFFYHFDNSDQDILINNLNTRFNLNCMEILYQIEHKKYTLTTLSYLMSI